VVTLQFFRPEFNNSINNDLLLEVMSVLEYCEARSDVNVLVLEGLPDYFCTGMDFQAIDKGDSQVNSDLFFSILKHLSNGSQIVISKVEGLVNAGGMGFVAASDIVVAGENAVFALSEVLFGLLPACVLPFLIRRVGYQKASWLSLTTQSITAARAYQIGLVDEVEIDCSELLRKKLVRLSRLEACAIKELKTYMNDISPIHHNIQELATEKISSLIKSPMVLSNINNYLKQGKFPWEK
jgi:polyketide biosynthesis enoyl-CoA hydratase PksH